MDFEDLYNNIEEYRAFREDPIKRSEYEIWSNWKVRKMSDVIPKSQSFLNCLEIGCAFGVIVNKFSKLNNIPNVFGLDIAKVNTELGAKEYPSIKFITGTIEDIDVVKIAGIEEKKFDLIILCDIIEHIPDDLEFLKGVRKISKNVVIDLPLEKSRANAKRNYGVNDLSGHLRSYNLEDGLRLFKDAGFRIDKFKTEIVYHDKDCFKFMKATRDIRLSEKTLVKNVFWSLKYKFDDFIMQKIPSLYVKNYGTNLFAYLSSND